MTDFLAPLKILRRDRLARVAGPTFAISRPYNRLLHYDDQIIATTENVINVKDSAAPHLSLSDSARASRSTAPKRHNV